MSTLPPIAWGGDGLVPVVIVDDRTGAVLTLAYADREALERTLASASTWLYSRSRRELWNKGATSGNTQRVVSVAVDCDADALVYRVVPGGPACHTGSASCFGPALRLDAGADRTGASIAAGDHVGATAAVQDRVATNAAVEDHVGSNAAVRNDAGMKHEAGEQAGMNDAGEVRRGAIEPTASGPGSSERGGLRFAAALGTLAATIAERKRFPMPESYTAKLFAGGVDRIGKKIGEEATEVVIAAKNADRGELIWETADLLYHTLVLLAEREISLDEVGAELTRRATPKP